MRVAFLGTPQAAVPSLEALVAAPDIEVVAVITNPDRPKGRGYKLAPPPVKECALAHGLDVLQPEKPGDILEQFKALNVDAAGVVAYGSLLRQDFLDAGGAGFVNLHYSLLPAWRGAAPVTHSMLNGEKTAGVSCFLLDKGMDSGDVIVTHPVPVLPQETAGELTARLSDIGAPILVEAIRSLVLGTATLTTQDHEQATFASKISREMALIDWTLSADRVVDTILAFNPMPGAHTLLDDKSVKIHMASVVAGKGEPGQVIAGSPDDVLTVACGQQAIAISSIQPAGKARMDASAFVNGYAPKRFGV